MRKIINLNENWELQSSIEAECLPITLPASVMNTYLAEGKIDDPYYRDNEDEALVIAENDYIFRKTFNVEGDILSDEYIWLVFHGIDTVADISLNGKVLLSTENMHRKYKVDVKDVLKKTANQLEIKLYSPLKYIQGKQEENPLPGVSHAVDGYQHLRKSHSMFGWDWGPKIPDLGIWKDVELVAWSSNRIEDIAISQQHETDRVYLDIKLEAQQSNHTLTWDIAITDPNGEELNASIDTSDKRVVLPVTIGNPKIWWPVGYGEQPLYDVTIRLSDGDTIYDERKMKIGLRTIQVRHEKDEWGKSFEFIVNGVALFMKGANYIPEDNLLPRTSKQRTERLIQDCLRANFNMIRVWGGGHYPHDDFYELCDESGILVWQDFMFACSVYPFTDSFVENVKQEAIDQIKRLRHHASLAIWCGNNEVEEAMEFWGWPKRADWRRDYIKLFEIILPDLVQRYDPETFYWSSSPSSGGGFDNPRNPDVGDMHYWEVWHGQKPFTEYRNYYFRFCSEFGFQSFPALKTIESFTLPEDRNIFSRIMEKHQKNDDANGKILYYLSQNFLYPKDLDALIYTSQLLQAEAMKYGVEHWRRNRGRCMGALYWQLNDCWPVASWSSIDYFGRWKALHYFAKKFYNPILLSIEESDTSAKVFVTNDTFDDVDGRVVWKLRNNKSEIIESGTIDIMVDSLTAREIAALDFSEHLDGKLIHETYLEAELYINDRSYSNSTVMFTKPKHFMFLNPELTAAVKETDTQFQINITSAAFAKYVEVSLSLDAVLSDNYFDLSAGDTKIITIDKKELPPEMTMKDLEKLIQLRSIYNIAQI
ncbi:beta-mannosidase [Gracilibacillus halotolerans]|uniref:Beta-mannosidase B n=1 Tax=Gracilibacillus halotolerans TaxID=74386 RepID=A0A841RQX1_9BACI|nr:glycoside hydrolase family 2 protein [Gracilibacillus halotolerans]MBB6514227.1 beta-mannosidase [Gracilibacillus halotolerans]